MLPLEKPCFSETGWVVVNIVMPAVLSVNKTNDKGGISLGKIAYYIGSTNSEMSYVYVSVFKLIL